MEFLDSLEELLKIDDRPVEEFEVPEWNVKVRLRGMTGNDRDAYEAHVTNGGQEGSVNLIGMRAKLVGACLVNADGQRIAGSREEAKLGQMGAKGLNRVFEKCLELNGMSEEDVKELESNFSETASDSSSSS